MKRNVTLFGMVVMLLVTMNVVFAQVEQVTQLDVTKVKKMQFEERDGNLFIKSHLLFVNGSDKDVKLRNFTMDIALKISEVPKEGEEQKEPTVLPLGATTIVESVIPAAVGDQKGELLQEIAIDLGPKNDDTNAKVFTLFNVIGDPQRYFTMTLNGSGEVGIKHDKGWVYQKGISVEFEFKPSIQQEWLIL
ncbi:hypothetical protein JW979_03115 [bacterium]|nr:hypothetical protein [candidate division CSSED10-310 bacterium]